MKPTQEQEEIRPTDEQAAILEAFRTGDGLTIEAGAGSGKTSTLRMLSQGTRKRGTYIAYNRSVKEDAVKSFPRNVRPLTSHGLAYGPVATAYIRAGRQVRGARVPAQRMAQILRIREPLRIADDKAPYAPQQVARLALAMVNGFCKSGDPELTRRHLSRLDGLTPLEQKTVAEAVLPYARRAWDDLLDVDRGMLRFEDNHYLKIYQLSRPRLSGDFLLVDEAQDLNPCVAAIVQAQTHMQVVYVGDRCQAINGWNGAVDAMEHAPGKRLYLTQSFRFGQSIADEANKWLSILDAPMQLRGTERIASRVEAVDAPDAVLCRTNATAFSRVLAAASEGRRAALVGGGKDLAAFARAARDLQDGRGTDHPEWLAFSNWREVQAYVEQDEAAGDTKVLAKLIDTYGPDMVLAIAEGLVDEDRAEVVISTAHKSKGREWPEVQVASDFREPPSWGAISREDAMLAYVTVTRAQEVLDREGLAWVDAWVPGAAYLDDPAERIAGVAEVAPEYVVPVDEPDDAARLDPPASLMDRHRQSCPYGCLLCVDDIQSRWPAPLPAGGGLR